MTANPSESDVEELRRRLLKAGPPRSVKLLESIVNGVGQIEHLDEQVSQAARRRRGSLRTILRPFHNAQSLLETLQSPENGEPAIIFEFFREVAPIERLFWKKRTLSWLKPEPSFVLAALATLVKNEGVRLSLPGFKAKQGLSDVELWAGLFVYHNAIIVRDELEKYFDVADSCLICGFCRCLHLSTRKYCSDRCLQAANEAMKYSRLREVRLTKPKSGGK